MKLTVLFTLIILFASSQQAQTFNGTVTDPQGAAVRHANISVMRKSDVILRTRSDESGNFSLVVGDSADLLLRVVATGFTDFESLLKDVSWPAVIKLQPRSVRESVTVSITKTGSRLEETPASVVVLDRDDLESTAAQTIDDSLRQIAGFTLFRRSSSRTSNPTAQGANLRGVGGSGAARTAVQFDGVSLNDAFGGWTFWSRVPDIAIERVEVFRGGASSLFGSLALSGAIEMSTASERQNTIRFEGSGGSQRTIDGGLFASVNHRSWYADFAGESFQTAGYIPIAPDQRGTADTRANSRHNSGFITIERRFGEHARIFGRGQLFAERRDNGTALTNNRTYFRQAVAGGDVSDTTFGSFQLRVAMDGQVYDQTFSAVSADRNSESLTRVQRVPSRAVWASAFWTRSFRDHSISAQADSRYVRGFSEEVALSNSIATALVTAGGKEFTFGVFVQDFWRVTSRLNLTLGGRFDRWREFGGLSRTVSLVGNQPSETIFSQRGEQSFSPRVAAIYRLTDAVSIFASFSRSFRAPSLNELYRSFRVGNVVTQANERLRAERARTIEAGINLTGFSRRVTVRGNVFQTNVTDPVVSVTLSSAPTLIIRRRENVGETRTRGIEADTEILASDKLRLSFGYLFADSRVVDAGPNTTLVGKRLPQVARQQFTSQLVYRPRRTITLSLQARGSDAQFDDDLNNFRLRPYFTLDAYAAYRFRKWVEIFTAAENAFNSRYDVGLTPVRTIAAPVSLRAGFRFDLNRKD